MNRSAEQLDEKIARIRKQNEEIIRKKKIIEEEIKSAARNNAIVNVKKSYSEEDNEASKLYADSVSTAARQHQTLVYPKIETSRPRKTDRQRGQEDAAWRREREQIDKERIRRQKAASGWRRAWDADKSFEAEETHSERNQRDTSGRTQKRQLASSRLEEWKCEGSKTDKSSNGVRANVDEPPKAETKARQTSGSQNLSSSRVGANVDELPKTAAKAWQTSGPLNLSRTIKVDEGGLPKVKIGVTKFSETKVQQQPKRPYSFRSDFSNRDDEESVADLSRNMKNIVIRVKNVASDEVARTVEVVGESSTNAEQQPRAASTPVFNFSKPAADRSTTFSFGNVGRSNVFSFGDAETSLGLKNCSKVTSSLSEATSVGILKKSSAPSSTEKARSETKPKKSVMIQDEFEKNEVNEECVAEDDDDEWEDVDEEWEDV